MKPARHLQSFTDRGLRLATDNSPKNLTSSVNERAVAEPEHNGVGVPIEFQPDLHVMVCADQGKRCQKTGSPYGNLASRQRGFDLRHTLSDPPPQLCTMKFRLPMTVLICLLTTLLPQVHAAGAYQVFALMSDSLGPLPLYPGVKITLKDLQRLFPQSLVKYAIGTGDSLNFHVINVINEQGDMMLSIKSFISPQHASANLDTGIPVDELRVHSPSIPDAYGLRVGHRVSDVMRKRDGPLTWSAGHHSWSVGAGSIFYSLEPLPGNDTLGTSKEAVEQNLKIHHITWPSPAWD